ncbi:MAG: winged helix-turn-helix domain-containing protein [Nanoarchaeota archaeon]|nr:winged helix DNA-binding protein [Nanoarchaeota archaeon]MBU1031140.1 winged helix DNA-binding protein [Nanoarchaeota archaeon]MBU1850143.1 winged helix DNA-binding protein [Nanoarchaeota archaeon]
MNKKRDRLEVIYDVLDIVRKNNNSIKPTPLLRKSNLSSQSFSEYLKELLDKEFLKEMNNKKERKCYTLTDKGFSYLEKYQAIIGFINDFEL